MRTELDVRWTKSGRDGQSNPIIQMESPIVDPRAQDVGEWGSDTLEQLAKKRDW